jgi:hypothetical protein
MDGTWATKDSIWAVGATARASERNIRLAIGSCVVGSLEWGATPIAILQQAAQGLVYTKSGLAYAWIAGFGPPEAIQSGDIMKLACRLGKDEAMELVGKILVRIEEIKPNFTPNTRTLSFRDIYDLKTIEPLAEHMAVFDQGREELTRLGLRLS